MKIALISDLHSNYLALNAVLEDIKKHSVEEIFCLGDLVGYAPYPDKIFPILKDSNIKIIMGNYDEGIAFSKDGCGCGYISFMSTAMGRISFEWTVKHTSEEYKELMRNLPREIRLNVNNQNILLVHGSPEDISGRIDPDITDEELDAIMKEANADILFCGHIHWPFHKILDKKHIVNPGSAGKPRIGSPQANYALVDLSKGCSVKFRLVDYDYESFAKEIENSDIPQNNFAEVIRTGYWKF